MIGTRTAEIKDSESILELSEQLGYNTTIEDIKSRISKILNHSDNCAFVALEGTKVIGWIHGFYTLRVESEFFVEIGGLVVHKNFRGKGAGNILVEQVTKWAKSKNTHLLRVRSNIIRIESHKFYEKIGFSMKKEQKIFDKYLN